MTNHWIDLRHSDVIMIIGSNAAENHPISFKWVTEAIEQRGAKLISVDPRFTRTSARAHIYSPMRSGTDIAFMGGMIKYILDNNLFHDEYLKYYTNASFVIDPGYEFEEGLFSGFDGKNKYDKATWQYQIVDGQPVRDMELKDPQCVMQLLKKHYAGYDLETVSNITGTPIESLKSVYKTYASTGAPTKAGTIMYAMGTTQHTYGTQNIRTYVITQLLLGNIGRAGGGINALRGESNVQGSTDMCLLFHILPGYLKTPVDADQTLDGYMAKYYEDKALGGQSLAWWGHARKYMVSLLKEWYGKEASKVNDFRYSWLPKNAGNYSHISLFEDMAKGIIKGSFFFGQNPAVGGPNTLMERDALAKLDWMVAVDLWETETSVFWKRDGVNPAEINTEVFRLPALASVEKEGSISNSGRWVQWRYKGGDGPGEAMDDLWILHRLQKEIAKLYKKNPGKFSDAITKLNWPYDDGHGHPDVHKVAKAINGYDVKTGEQVKNFTKLSAEGATASGNWLYSGAYNADGNNMARRDNKDTHLGMYHNWSWCWPVNRRIIYNRASVDINGKPWNPELPVITYDEGTGKWSGDVPDGGMPPLAKADPNKPALPFIMKNEGVANVFAAGLADGPFPVHYEPMEAPVDNAMYPKQQTNPAAFVYEGASGEFAKRDEYPIVCTTYRVSEHWQAGAMTRSLPWLNELFPELFVEMSQELAKAKGIANGDLVKIWNPRGTVVAKACVTARFKPLKVGGKMVETVGLPWHWGYCGLCSGDSANILTPHVGDANTRIPEFKSFLVDVKKA
jgi:formate dehydrogenase-N alpha subunit